MWYLYAVTNLVNGKQYVGITVNTGRRWIEHKSGRGSKLVQRALRKYGLENFRLDILYEGCEEDIKQLEIDLIAQRNTKAPGGYNLTDGGEGRKGWILTEETRQKMSESRKGTKNGMFGKKHSKETKEKIREKAKKRKRQKHSKETRQKISEAHKGRKFSRETRRKMSEASKGKKHTRAAREKMSKARTGGKHPNAHQVLVNGRVYTCMRYAAEAENIKYSTLKRKFQECYKSSYWPIGWAYLT